jgi:hypothetical protein
MLVVSGTGDQEIRRSGDRIFGASLRVFPLDLLIFWSPV